MFVKKQTHERGRQLKVTIDILFHGDNSCTAALRQMKVWTVKDHGHTYKFYLNISSLTVFEYGGGSKC
jgi:hypothetical protein